MPRYQRRKVERPDEIVDAAFRSFAERGYADTRLDEVADRAGVSKGLVYLYFKTKEELFKAVVRQVVVPRLDALDLRVVDEAESVAAFLRGPFVDHVGRLLDSPVRYVLRLLIAEGPKHPDLTEYYHREVVSRVLVMLRRLIQRGVDSGEFRPGTGYEQFPQLIVAPVVMSVVWRALFDRHERLDVRGLLATHVEHVITVLTSPGAAGDR